MSPRETRVVALGKPSDRERTSWYCQRYVPYLPAAREFVLFNRSWYNRAGVERVMGFCFITPTKTKSRSARTRRIVFAYDVSSVDNGQLAR